MFVIRMIIWMCFCFFGDRDNLLETNDLAVVQIYYPMVETTLFMADVVMTWQEIVSKYSNFNGNDMDSNHYVIKEDFILVFSIHSLLPLQVISAAF